MDLKNNFEDITFEGFQNNYEEKGFLIEKVQSLIDKLPYDSRYHVNFQKKNGEYFCSFKATSINAVFFAIVSGDSIENLQKKVDSGIEQQILNWYQFRSEREGIHETNEFKRFIPKRFSFFNRNKKKSKVVMD